MDLADIMGRLPKEGSPPSAAPPEDSFWPGIGLAEGLRYERHEDFHLVRVRHLPTAGTVGATVAALPAARSVVEAWAEAWSSPTLDVEALAGLVGYAGPADRPEPPHDDGKVRALLDRGERAAAAQALVVASRARGRGPVRPFAFHVLEDASVFLFMAGAGVPLVLALDFGRSAPMFFDALERRGALDVRPVEGKEAEPYRKRLEWQESVVNPDWASEAFRAAAGRRIGCRTSHPVVVAALRDMALQGHRRAFLKHVVPKRGTWTVDLDGADDVAVASERLMTALGLSCQDLFLPMPHGSLTVQEHLPFTHEHRFFCVGHRVVASTASVRGLSLLDHAGRLLDPRVARLARPSGPHGTYDRGESEAVVDRGLVARMAWKARALARDLAAEGRYQGQYVIDMGLTERGVCAVEVNTFGNAGLYAVDMPRLSRSLARWYADPSRRRHVGTAEEPVRRSPGGLWELVAAQGRPRPGIAGLISGLVGGRRRRRDAAAYRHPDDDEFLWMSHVVFSVLARVQGRASGQGGAAGGWRSVGDDGD